MCTDDDPEIPQAPTDLVVQAIAVKLVRTIECIAMADALAEWYGEVYAKGWLLELPPIIALYDGMWDAATLSQGTIWDAPTSRHKAMLSLPRLKDRLKNEGVTLELGIAGEARSKLVVHRDRVVAHSEYIDNLEKHEEQFGLELADLWSDVELTARVVGPLLHKQGIPFDLETERGTARASAGRFLEVLRKGMQKIQEESRSAPASRRLKD